MVVQTEKQGHLFNITLNRPEARNAVNGDLAQSLEAALDEFENDPELWVAILSGHGKVFSAGADLKEVAAGNVGRLSTQRGGFAGLAKRERSKPLIAAVHGAALAGGCEIALACDLIVAADDAKFGLPEVKRSLVAGAGGLFRLPRAIGKAVGMELVLTAEPIDARRAYELGMINRCVPVGELMASAVELAHLIMANAPLAVQASRGVVERALTDDDETLWRASGNAMKSLMQSEDFQEGPRAFIEKRAPSWKAR